MSEVSSIRKVLIERAAEKFTDKSGEKKSVPSSPIGIFDSGVGGLTVLREVVHQLPNEDVVYLADTARVPYGGRPPEEIIKINAEIIPYLINEHGVKLIIIACGTSSAIAYPVLKDKYKAHMIELIGPGSRAAAAATHNDNVGLIATVGTVNSGAYEKNLHALKKEIKLTAQACPLFVPLIEGGFIENDETRKVVKEYLKPLLKAEIDTLILGCTHYPHLSKLLKERTGPKVTLINPAEEAVQDAKKLLVKFGTIKNKTASPKYEYLVTGSVSQFQDIGSRLMGRALPRAKQVKTG